jgi:type IV pilus assembly protein PilV
MRVTPFRHSTSSAGRALHRRAPTFPAQMRGVGLIEVLIAVLVLAVGLLGIAAMQATALRNSQSALERSIAVTQSYAILDAMRANQAVASIGGYDLGMTCAPPATGTLAQNDLNGWITALQASLGAAACGSIACTDTQCQVSVQWDDSRALGGNNTETVTTWSRIR